MHRLEVVSFRERLMGRGCGNAGFSAAVFSVSIDVELLPNPSAQICSYTDSDLEKVRSLHLWYCSPSCPIEKEFVTTSSDAHASERKEQAPGSLSEAVLDVSPVRLHSSKLDTFLDIEGQVVSVYRFAETDNCLLIYLWDGEPSQAPEVLPAFIGPPHTHLADLLASSAHCPFLVALTGHDLLATSEGPLGLQPTDGPPDWSVPVFIFDEHATSEVAKSLLPGCLVRLKNVHALRPLRVKSSSCGIQLLLQGGGQRYGRSIKQLAPASSSGWRNIYPARADDLSALEDANRFGLVDRLLAGILQRPPLARPVSQSAQLLQPLPISHISRLPVLSSGPFSSPDEASLDSVSLEWLMYDNNLFLTEIGSEYNSLRVRVCSRVVEVFPRTRSQVRDTLFMVCHRCFTALRVSTFDDDMSFDCGCPASERDLSVSLCLVFWLLLEDPTGWLVVSAIGRPAEDLLRTSKESVLVAGAESQSSWCQLCLGDETSAQFIRLADHLVKTLRHYESGWIDALLSISWPADAQLTMVRPSSGSTPHTTDLPLVVHLLDSQPQPSTHC